MMGLSHTASPIYLVRNYPNLGIVWEDCNLNPNNGVHLATPTPPAPLLFSQLFDLMYNLNSPRPDSDRKCSDDNLERINGAALPTDFPLVFVSHGPREDNLVLKVPYDLVDARK